MRGDDLKVQEAGNLERQMQARAWSICGRYKPQRSLSEQVGGRSREGGREERGQVTAGWGLTIRVKASIDPTGCTPYKQAPALRITTALALVSPPLTRANTLSTASPSETGLRHPCPYPSLLLP